jgi:hypothetical protein
VLETALNQELPRNGPRPKTVLTESSGQVQIEMPERARLVGGNIPEGWTGAAITWDGPGVGTACAETQPLQAGTRTGARGPGFWPPSGTEHYMREI